MLRVKLFGKPQIYLNHYRLTELLKPQGIALFSYLIMTEKPQERTTLSQLFWPTLPLWRAKINLNYQIRRLQWLMGNYIISTRKQLFFNHKLPHWLDVKVFASLATVIPVYTDLSSTQPTSQAAKKPDIIYELLDLYRGDFLAGFEPEHAPLYTTWVTSLGDALRKQKETIACIERPSKMPHSKTNQAGLYIQPQLEENILQPIRDRIQGRTNLESLTKNSSFLC